MNCSGDNYQENECRNGFQDCSDSIEPDEDRKWKGVDDVPGLNLDTLQDEGFQTCVLLFYNCSLSLDSCRQEFSQCALKNSNSPIDEEQNTLKPSVIRITTAKSSVTKRPNQKTPNPVQKNKVKDVHTPSLEAGSGKIPESKFHDMSNSFHFICTIQFNAPGHSSCARKVPQNARRSILIVSMGMFVSLFQHISLVFKFLHR